MKIIELKRLIFAVAMIMAVGSCASSPEGGKRGDRRGGGDTETSEAGKRKAPEVEQAEQLAQAQPRVSLRNYEEINRTYSALTGIPMADMREAYQKVFGSLPKSTDVRDLSGASLSSYRDLAANYCDAMVNNQTLIAQRFPGIDFSQSAGNTFADLEGFIENLLGQFWGVDLENVPPLSEAMPIFLDLVNELIVDHPQSTGANIYVGACTLALISTPVLTR